MEIKKSMLSDVLHKEAWRSAWLIVGSCACVVLLFPDRALYADDHTIDKPLFYIERNKNRNLVQYAIMMQPNSCKAASDEPVYGYWRDLEEGPDVTSPLLWYEKPAYGIKSQKVEGRVVHVRLTALPERQIDVSIREDDSSCSAQATTEINGLRSMLKQIYVFAEEGWIRPTVKWIELRGTLSSKAVVERIVVD